MEDGTAAVEATAEVEEVQETEKVETGGSDSFDINPALGAILRHYAPDLDVESAVDRVYMNAKGESIYVPDTKEADNGQETAETPVTRKPARKPTPVATRAMPAKPEPADMSEEMLLSWYEDQLKMPAIR